MKLATETITNSLTETVQIIQLFTTIQYSITPPQTDGQWNRLGVWSIRVEIE